jgi:hypothetical protein
MGWAAMEWAIDQRGEQRLSAAEQSVLVTYASYIADGEIDTFVGQETVARRLGVHRNAVGAALGRLEAKGIISREPRFRPQGRGRTSDRVALLNYSPTNARKRVPYSGDQRTAESALIDRGTDQHTETAATNARSTDEQRTVERPSNARSGAQEPEENQKIGTRREPEEHLLFQLQILDRRGTRPRRQNRMSRPGLGTARRLPEATFAISSWHSPNSTATGLAAPLTDAETSVSRKRFSIT